MYESDKNRVINLIDNFILVLETRLLPTFENIEIEAKEIEQRRLEDLSLNFNPDIMDEADCYEDAYFTGLKHYEIYTEMKQSVLNMSSVWLYHIFEKESDIIFSDKKWKERKLKLSKLSIPLIAPSNFYKIDKELQSICNINKHGNGDSQKALFKIRPDLFETKTFSTKEYLKNISFIQIKEYAENIKLFWIEVYEQVQKSKLSI